MSVKPIFPIKLILIIFLFVCTGGIFGIVLLIKKYRKKHRAPTEQTTVCINCGYAVNPDRILCPKCGKFLNEIRSE